MPKQTFIIMMSLVLIFSMIIPVSAGTTNEIAINDRITGTIETSEYDDVNVYFIKVTEQGVLTIDAEYMNRTYSIGLYNSGTHNYYMDGFAVQENREVQYALKPGEYRINVSGTKGANYAFQLNFENGEHYDAEPNNTFETGVAIPPDTTINGFANKFNSAYKDVYIFEAKKAEKIVLEKQDAEIALFSKSGIKLYDSPVEEGSFELDVKAGVYYVEVLGDMYTFSYHFDDVQPLVELEPNNTIALAQPVEVNTNYSGKISGNTDELDLYTFTLDKPGLLTVDIPEIKPWITLYDQDGEMLSSDVDYVGYQVALKAGQYTIGLRMQHLKQTTPYTLNLQVSPVEYTSLEPNNSVELAQPIQFGEIIQQVTKTSLMHDNFYKVEVPEDGLLTLETSHLNAWVSLMNDQNEYLPLHEQETTHTVGVKKGTYYFNLKSGTEPRSFVVKFTARPVEYESNDSKLTAQSLPHNVTMRGFVSSENGIDVFKLEVAEAGNYSISFSGLDKTLTVPHVKLENDQGDIVADAIATTGTKKVSLQPGVYYVSVNKESQYAYNVSWKKEATALFSDVSLQHPYFEEIMSLHALGVITGYGDQTFKPKNSIKRHHVAAMLVRSKAPNIPQQLTMDYRFKDVAKTHANFMNIHLLAQAGIVSKNALGFKPNNTITRAQMAKMIVHAFGLTYNEVAPAQTFKDVKASAWHHDYVQILASHGITTGSNGYFKPNDPLTRQHFSLFLARALKISGQ